MEAERYARTTAFSDPIVGSAKVCFTTSGFGASGGASLTPRGPRPGLSENGGCGYSEKYSPPAGG
jgi:hypothetical protein